MIYKFSNNISRPHFWTAVSLLQALIIICHSFISMANDTPPMRVLIVNQDTLVVGQQMTVKITLEALKDITDIKFDVAIPYQGWRFAGGQTIWVGHLKAKEKVQWDIFVIPTVANPEPIKGRLSVSGWPNTGWMMEMRRLNGKTREAEKGQAPAEEASVGEPGSAQVKPSGSSPQLSPEELQHLEEILERTHLHGPPLPLAPTPKKSNSPEVIKTPHKTGPADIRRGKDKEKWK